MRLLLALCLGAILTLDASAIPMEAITALASPLPPPAAPPQAPEPSGDEDRTDSQQQQSKKGLLSRIYKTKVINLPSKGMQIVLLPWKCYNQSSCQQKPKCVVAGGETVCTIECYACNSCVQPKIVRKKLKNGKIKETRKSYIRTHRCGACFSRSQCSVAPCPAPKPCTLHSKG